MNKQEFSGAMQQRGCVSDGNNFCGTYNDYPFTATFSGGNTGGKTVFFMSILFAQSVPTKLYSQLGKEMKPYARVQRHPSNNVHTALYIMVTVPAGADFNTVFDKLISECVTAAQAYQLTAPTHCPICNQPNCDSLGYHAFYQPVHYACVQKKNQTQLEKAVKNQAEGSYVLGILGAVIGAVVGALPTVLTIALLSIISGWLCALIPLGSYYGYKLCKGKLTKITPVIVILITLIVAPLTYWVSTALSAQGDIGYFISLGELISLIRIYPGEFAKDLLTTAFFMLLGIAMVFGVIRRTSSHDIASASFNLATLRPIAGMEQTVSAQQAAAQQPAAPVQPQAAPAQQPMEAAPVAQPAEAAQAEPVQQGESPSQGE